MSAVTVPTEHDEAADSPPRKVKQHAAGPKTPWYMWIAVGAIVVFCLFPFYWLVSLSLKTGADLSSSSLIPPNPTLANYKSIFQNDDFVRALGNSVIISVVTTALAITVGSF